MKDNNPYKQFAKFDFTDILKRLKGKVVKLASASNLGNKVTLLDIELIDPIPTFLDHIIKLTYETPFGESHTLHTPRTFQEFLDLNQEPTYIIYYKSITGIGSTPQTQESFQSQCDYITKHLQYKILHVIKKNPDGTEELVKF